MNYFTVETRELEDLRRKHSVACALLQDQTTTIVQLRSTLERAVREINRIGPHSGTTPENCPTCQVVRSYGFDPEALRE
jgi:hypothetical protein